MATAVVPKSSRQLFFFLLSGGAGFAIYYVLSNGLYYLLHVAPVLSALLAMLASVPVSYFMQKNLTFKHRPTSSKTMPRYLLLQAVNASVIGSVTYLCNRFSLPQAINFAVAGFMGVVVSFAIQERLVFQEDK